MKVSPHRTGMAGREPLTQEPPSNWRVSLAFWLCLFCAAAAYGSVSLAPGYMTYLDVRQEYLEGQQRLVATEWQIEHFEKVTQALQQDPRFQTELARIDLGLQTQGERIPVGEGLAMHAVYDLPEVEAPVPMRPWFAPLVHVLAEQPAARGGVLLFSAGLVLFAFTYLQASSRQGRGLLDDTAGALVRRYLREDSQSRD